MIKMAGFFTVHKGERTMERKKMRDWLWLGTALLLVWFVLQHAGSLVGFLQTLWGILSPFLMGAALAFVLNVPMSFLERRLLFFLDRNPRPQKAKRPVALLLTLLLALLVVYLVMALVVPEIIATVETIVKAVPGFLEQVDAWLAGYDFQLKDWIVSRVKLPTGPELEAQLGNMVNIALKGVALSGTVIGSVYQNVLSGFFTIMFVIYFLLGKERLKRQAERLLLAFLPAPRVEGILRVARLTKRTFSSFITGQCLEAVILGLLFFVFMSIFRMPYVLLISVFIAVTALIPVIGAWMGCIVGAFLILVGDPVQALWFVALFLVLQQLEGNIIYPRVMGNAIGLPSIWVLFAVVLGEGLMGILGMLLFIPLMSVCYKLLAEKVNERLKKKTVSP